MSGLQIFQPLYRFYPFYRLSKYYEIVEKSKMETRAFVKKVRYAEVFPLLLQFLKIFFEPLN